MTTRSTIKHVDEQQLETNLVRRCEYVSEVIGFSQDDIDAIHAVAELMEPFVPEIVDAVYDKLFSYDAMKRHFMPKQSGYAGASPESLEALTLYHDVIAFRKRHLGQYLLHLVNEPYDDLMFTRLNEAGKIHTSTLGSEELAVPLVQMNALLGFVSETLLSTIFDLGLPRAQEVSTVRAFNKLLWLQNDLITRHYQA